MWSWEEGRAGIQGELRKTDVGSRGQPEHSLFSCSWPWEPFPISTAELRGRGVNFLLCFISYSGLFSRLLQAIENKLLILFIETTTTWWGLVPPPIIKIWIVRLQQSQPVKGEQWISPVYNSWSTIWHRNVHYSTPQRTRVGVYLLSAGTSTAV